VLGGPVSMIKDNRKFTPGTFDEYGLYIARLEDLSLVDSLLTEVQDSGISDDTEVVLPLFNRALNQIPGTEETNFYILSSNANGKGIVIMIKFAQ